MVLDLWHAAQLLQTVAGPANLIAASPGSTEAAGSLRFGSAYRQTSPRPAKQPAARV